MVETANDPAMWWREIERLSRMLGEVGPDEICCAGLTPRQTSILRILIGSEGARLSDLAELSHITPSAMTRVIEKLEAQNLVERVRGTQSDGRAAMVRITARGRNVRALIDKMMIDGATTIMSAIPEQERPNVLRALGVLAKVLEQTGGCCGMNVNQQLVSIGTNSPTHS